MNDEQGMACVTLCHVESLTLHPFAVIGAAVAHPGHKNVVFDSPSSHTVGRKVADKKGCCNGR